MRPYRRYTAAVLLELFPNKGSGRLSSQKAMEGGQPTGPHSRDNRQIKALTGLSQAQFDYLLPVFSDMYQTRMIPLVSVLGFGTWSFLIKEQLYRLAAAARTGSARSPDCGGRTHRRGDRAPWVRCDRAPRTAPNSGRHASPVRHREPPPGASGDSARRSGGAP